jgi:hypothetical protein
VDKIKTKTKMRRNYNTTNFYARRDRNWTRNQNTVKYTTVSAKLGPVSHTIFIGLAIAVLGLIYLTQAAKITNYDYQAQAIDNEIAELTSQKDDLEVENARLTALNTIRNSETAKAMVTPSTTGSVDR